ncbi:MAG: ComF family protein [Ardenticatenaceae bacterium]|nr:ComF family protein [Ardenticatenaceae bacterium]MCB9446342.1 ComF family protein [Ardenticatenaceae bacterium]
MTNRTHLLGDSWLLQAKHLTNNLLNFIFPPVCANCKKPGQLLCAECLAAITWLEKPICAHCGRVVAKETSRCPACSRTPLYPVDPVRAAVIFAEPIPTIIHQLKYNGFFGLAAPLANLMVEAWSKWHMPVDLVVGVPLHPQREKKRGYNQSDLLAHHFCNQVGLNADKKALQRVRNTSPQVGLGASERVSNVANAFVADGLRVAGKHVLLVDDVCTTGSTLKAAAEALMAAGAKRVSGYCLARAL